MIIQFDPIYNSTGNYYMDGIIYITVYEQIIIKDAK